MTTVLAALVGAAFLTLGTGKVLAVPTMRARAAHAGFTVAAYRRIGVLEVAGALGVLVGLAVPRLGVLAAAGLLLLMAGALATHVRIRDGLAEMAPAVTVGLLVACYLTVAL
jgi:hypothetical protein